MPDLFSIDPGKYVVVEHRDGYRTATSPYDIPEYFSATLDREWLRFQFDYITNQPMHAKTVIFEDTWAKLRIETASHRLRHVEVLLDGVDPDVAKARALRFLQSNSKRFSNPDMMFRIVSDHLDLALAHQALPA